MRKQVYIVAALVCMTISRAIGEDCSTKQCGDGRKCNMAGGMRPYCALDRSVCRLPVTGVPCSPSAPSYYYDRSHSRCTMYKDGCGATRNRFQTIRDCLITCRIYSFFFRRGRLGFAMKIFLFSVATVLVCPAFAQFGENSQSHVQKKACFYACKAGGPPPPQCDCSTIKTCENYPCPDGQRCTMMKEVYRICLKPSEDCRMPHSEVEPCPETEKGKPYYYYDPDQFRCFRYSYGMCAKPRNKNVFEKLGACYFACARRHKADCLLAPSMSICDTTGMRARFSFDTKSGYCLPMMRGQCSNNNNEFKSKFHCAKICKDGKVHIFKTRNPEDHSYLPVPKENCELPVLTKPCNSMISGFHFNRESGRCMRYPAYRCAANLNQFSNGYHCKLVCNSLVSDTVSKADCMLPYETTTCDKSQVNFYFRKRINACKRYPAGECAINKNSFGNLQKCVDVCRGGVLRG